MQALRGKLSQLGLQKFSSNVVELVLQMSPPEVQACFVEELSSKESASMLMSSVYGMHVAHQLLKVVRPELRVVLEGICSASLRGSRNQRLREKWEGILSGDAPSPVSPSGVSACCRLDEDVQSAMPGIHGDPSADATRSPVTNTGRTRRRRGGRGVSGPAGSHRLGLPETGGRGVLTPGLLMTSET